MAMIDISFCGTFCDQKKCERNLRFHKPQEKYYSASNFDEKNPDQSHGSCPHKLIKKEV